MIIDFTKKTALICGATSGIGLATANEIAKAGGSIILLGRSRKKLTLALKSLDDSSGQHHEVIEGDLSKPDQITQIVEIFVKDHNRLDILVNNSGGPLPKNILKCETQDYQHVFNQQFLSVQVITSKVIELMRNNNFGRIINILGTSIKEPIRELPLSSVKAITEVWAKALSKEVGKFNITVNNILPGPTNTNELKKIVKILAMNEGISDVEYLIKVTNNTALGRIAEAKEIANLITFIASENSSYLTGANIIVDGGYTSGL